MTPPHPPPPEKKNHRYWKKKIRVLLYVWNPTFNFAGLNVIKFDAEKIIKALDIIGWDVTTTRSTGTICIYMYIIHINYVVQDLDWRRSSINDINLHTYGVFMRVFYLYICLSFLKNFYTRKEFPLTNISPSAYQLHAINISPWYAFGYKYMCIYFNFTRPQVKRKIGKAKYILQKEFKQKW